MERRCLVSAAPVRLVCVILLLYSTNLIQKFKMFMCEATLSVKMMRPRLRLVSIAHSHYCESARWVLALAGLAVREHAFTFSYKTGELNRAYTSFSKPLRATGEAAQYSSAARVAVGTFEELGDEVVQARQQTMVPVARGSGGELLLNSGDIANYASVASGGELAAPTSELVPILDTVAAAIRYLWYASISPTVALGGMSTGEVTGDELAHLTARYYFCVGDQVSFESEFAAFRPHFEAEGARCARVFRFDEEERFLRKATVCIDDTFAAVAERLAASGGPYLGGARVGCDDVLLAGHCAFLLMPPNYGEGTLTRWPTVSEVSPAYRALVTKYRDTPAGELILRTYAEHRGLRKDVPPPDVRINPAYEDDPW